MKKNYLLMCLCLLAGGFAGCSDDDSGPSWKELFDKEQANIKAFVADKSPLHEFKYTVTYLGETFDDYAYVFRYDEDVNKKRPKNGQFVLVNYIQRSLDGKLLDATDKSLTGGSNIESLFPTGGPIYEKITSTSDQDDIFSECLKYIPEGTKGEIILSSMMTLGTYMYREYRVEKIIEGELLDYEYKLIDDFLTKKEINKDDIIKVPETGNDTITQIVKLNSNQTGEPILVSDSVTIQGSGYILDEISGDELINRKLFENEKASWKVSALIDGMQAGLLNMKVGEEAYILIPSGRGYGIGFFDSYNYQYIIPPYATLVYKIEVLSRKANDK